MEGSTEVQQFVEPLLNVRGSAEGSVERIRFAVQYVHRRAARLYNAAFQLDPGRSGRRLAAWLRRATPMDVDGASKRGAPDHGSRKKSRGSS